MSDAEAIVRWLLALTVISVALAPILLWLGSGLGDVAAALIRPLGIILLTAMLWWPASLLGVPFTALTLAAVLVLAGGASWFWWFRSGNPVPIRPILAFEAIWLFLFSAYVFFRSYNPDIVNTEKPMEIAFLSSISRSSEVPAPDPWLAGETINYYYFGYQVFASLVKLAGVPTAVAFNLALATLFASVGVLVAGAGYRIAQAAGLTRAISLTVAAAALFFASFAGNLEAFLRLLRDPADTWNSDWWFSGVGWEASRIITDTGVHGNPAPRDTINEFPAFSFILGDLHPHVLTYPLLIGVALITLGFMSSQTTMTLKRTAVAGALGGLLYVSNSWDAPLGLILIVLAAVIGSGWNLRRLLVSTGVAAGSALVAAFPFILTFAPPVGVNEGDVPAAIADLPLIGRIVTTLGVVIWQPSSAGEFLTVHGVWIAGFALFAVVVGISNPALLAALRRWWPFAAAGTGLSLVVALAWAPAMFIAGVPLALATVIAIAVRLPEIRVTASLFAVGFLLTLIPEFVYIQDAFGDRMNTVFKLYFQAWILLAIATAAAIGIAMRQQRLIAIPFAILLVIVTLPYTPISARDWTANFDTRTGLDGSGYIARWSPDDLATIDWLEENAPEDAIIVEAPGCSYHHVAGIPSNRISAFTGIPTLVGWGGHQRQWRRGEEDRIDERVTDRQEIANTWLDGEPINTSDVPSPDYVVLGGQERSGSAECESMLSRDTDMSVIRLLDAGWQFVFESGNSRILARP